MTNPRTNPGPPRRHTLTDLPPLFGPYGRTALAHADALASHGANACWFHMFDAEAFDLCRRHGLHACVELKTLRADFGQRPELLPIGVDGEPIRHGRLVQGVCLSQQAFLDETAAARGRGASVCAGRHLARLPLRRGLVRDA